MASDAELNNIARDEFSIDPDLGARGTKVVEAAEAMVRGEKVPVVSEKGHSVLVSRAMKALPWVMAAGVVGAQAMIAVSEHRQRAAFYADRLY